MNKTRLNALIVVVVAILAAFSSVAWAASGPSRFRVALDGYHEVPLALSTSGSGSFKAKIDTRHQEITYELSYSALEGDVTQAHIHFGSPSQAGGISAFFCTNLGNGPAGTQACPAAPATVTGTIRPADVIGPAGQGITAGQFDELVAAMRAGATYVNVHSTVYPGGEIRAQLGKFK